LGPQIYEQTWTVKHKRTANCFNSESPDDDTNDERDGGKEDFRRFYEQEEHQYSIEVESS
jgi:hypothetical protein